MGRKLYTFRKTRLKQGLFGRYMPVEYIRNAANTIIKTGIMSDNSKTFEFYLRVKCNTTSSWYMFQARNAGGSAWGISGSTSGGTITFSGLTSDIRRTVGHVYEIRGVRSPTGKSLYVKDITAGTENSKTSDTPTTYADGTEIGLFGNVADGNRVASGHEVYRAYIKINGVIAWDMYPCVDTSNSNRVVAYDNVTHTGFVPSAGSVTAGSIIQPIAHTPNNGMQYWKKTQVLDRSSDNFGLIAGHLEGNSYVIDEVGWAGGNVNRFYFNVQLIKDHKYFLFFSINSPVSGSSYSVDYSYSLSRQITTDINYSVTAGVTVKISGITTADTTTNTEYRVGLPVSSASRVGDEIAISLFPELFDLTADFGVGNEPTTVAECEAHYGSNYVPYGSKDYLPVRVGSTVKMLDLESWTLATKTETFTPGADLPPEQDPVDYVIKKNNKLYLIGINGATHYTFQCPLGGSVLQVSDGATTTTVGEDDVGDFPEFTVYVFEHPLLPISIWMLKGKTGCTGTVTNSDGDTYDITEMTDMEVGLGAYGARIDASADLSI